MSSEYKVLMLTSYISPDSRNHGLLGQQMAATIISKITGNECLVLGLPVEEDFYPIKASLEIFLGDYFRGKRPVIAFSNQQTPTTDSQYLFWDMTQYADFTVIGGPNALSLFEGEVCKERYPHRFQGYSRFLDYSMMGPAEQFAYLLDAIPNGDLKSVPGLSFKKRNGRIRTNPPQAWDPQFLREVDWSNMLKMKSDGRIVNVDVEMGGVLYQIGCPYAAKERTVDIPPPSWMRNEIPVISVKSYGCTFCSIDSNIGYHGNVGLETAVEQARNLPERDKRKIPFYLVSEWVEPGAIKEFMNRCFGEGINLSDVHLEVRADWLTRYSTGLEDVLRAAGDYGSRVVISNVGFESFNDAALAAFGKGVTAETNFEAIEILRALKEGEFGDSFEYEPNGGLYGRVHGSIFPTLWDDVDSAQKEIDIIKGLPDIWRKPTMNKLGIPHNTALGEWIRTIELKSGVEFERDPRGFIKWFDNLDGKIYQLLWESDFLNILL